MSWLRPQRGFGTAEVLAALFIMAIVAAFAVPRLTGAGETQALQAQRAALQSAHEAAQDYFSGTAENEDGGATFDGLAGYNPSDSGLIPARRRTSASNVDDGFQWVFVRRAGQRGVDERSCEADGRLSDAAVSTNATPPCTFAPVPLNLTDLSPADDANIKRVLIAEARGTVLTLCNAGAEAVICLVDRGSSIEYGVSRFSSSMAAKAACHPSFGSAQASMDQPCAAPTVTISRDEGTDIDYQTTRTMTVTAVGYQRIGCTLDGTEISCPADGASVQEAPAGYFSSTFAVELPNLDASDHVLRVVASNARGEEQSSVVWRTLPPEVTITDVTSPNLADTVPVQFAVKGPGAVTCEVTSSDPDAPAPTYRFAASGGNQTGGCTSPLTVGSLVTDRSASYAIHVTVKSSAAPGGVTASATWTQARPLSRREQLVMNLNPFAYFSFFERSGELARNLVTERDPAAQSFDALGLDSRWARQPRPDAADDLQVRASDGGTLTTRALRADRSPAGLTLFGRLELGRGRALAPIVWTDSSMRKTLSFSASGERYTPAIEIVDKQTNGELERSVCSRAVQSDDLPSLRSVAIIIDRDATVLLLFGDEPNPLYDITCARLAADATSFRQVEWSTAEAADDLMVFERALDRSDVASLAANGQLVN